MNSRRSSPDIQFPIIALSADDSFLHVFRDVPELLGHAAESTDTKEPPRMDFFDSAGHRLTPCVDMNWQMCGLQRAEQREPARRIERRIGTALDRAQQLLTASPELGDGHTEVPRPAGRSLPEIAGALASDLELDVHGHRAGWFHNLLHASGKNHD